MNESGTGKGKREREREREMVRVQRLLLTIGMISLPHEIGHKLRLALQMFSLSFTNAALILMFLFHMNCRKDLSPMMRESMGGDRFGLCHSIGRGPECVCESC